MAMWSGKWRRWLRRDTRRPSSNRPRPQARLGLEPLEGREVLSTIFVEPSTYPIDASHVHTLQDAFNIAAANDTIQLEPGIHAAASNSYSGSDAAVALKAATTLGATSISVDRYVGAGEGIRFSAPGNIENALVTKVSPGPGNLFTLTLKDPLLATHAKGQRVDTTGLFGIAQPITLQGDGSISTASIDSRIAISVKATPVTLRSLLLPNGVQTDSGVTGMTIRNCTVKDVSGGFNGAANIFRENTITGSAFLFGTDSSTPSMDQVVNNRFMGGHFDCSNEDGLLVQGNTFEDPGGFSPVNISSSSNIVFSGNSIHTPPVEGSFAGTTAVLLQCGPNSTLSATLTNNTIDTGGVGIAVAILCGSAGSNVQVLLQANDLHNNSIGLQVYGDGSGTATAAGKVDAGGGPLNSLGGNNFRSFVTADAVANKRFAIYLTNTGGPAGTVSARNNLWSVADPRTVCADAQFNTNVSSPTATGMVDAGAAGQQLSADQQFVQAIYRDFLGRAGSSAEINSWTAAIPAIGTAGVANVIAGSGEALTRQVDKFYHQFLNRDPDQAGEAAWVSALLKGATLNQVMAGFVSAPEYLDRAEAFGPEPNSAFVQSIYVNLLGRTGSFSELSMWISVLNSQGRQAVALGILGSTEYSRIAVRQLYSTLLHRTSIPSDAEISGWVNLSPNLLAIEAAIAGSMEAYQNG